MTDNNLENQPATKGDIKLLKGDVALLKGEVALVKNDVALVKDDVALVKDDIQLLKGGIKGLKTDLGKAKTELTEKITRLAVDLSKTQEDVRQIKHGMSTNMSTKDDISRVMNAIDKFAAEASAYRNQDMLRGKTIMGHTEKLTNHETRIQKLEVK